ncbi:MAG: hypothetical protein ACK5VH_06505, partial [bacterium]
MNPTSRTFRSLRSSLFVLLLFLLGLHPNAQPGAIDVTFNPTDPGFGFGDGADYTVRSFAVQSDGKILIVGHFSTYN